MQQAAIHIIKQHVRYAEADQLQRELQQARIERVIPDTVLLLEHHPVVTMGRRGRANHLHLNAEEYASRGIDLHIASRGGDVTYHCPGQLVIYPIMHLKQNQSRAHGYLYHLEEVAIQTALYFGLNAYRREGMSGAWTDQGKFAAIGFYLKKWVSSHGMSINVCPDLGGFQWITPCGLAGHPVTSIQQVLGINAPDMPTFRNQFIQSFKERFHMQDAICTTHNTLCSLKKSLKV